MPSKPEWVCVSTFGISLLREAIIHKEELRPCMQQLPACQHGAYIKGKACVEAQHGGEEGCLGAQGGILHAGTPSMAVPLMFPERLVALVCSADIGDITNLPLAQSTSAGACMRGPGLLKLSR